MELSNFLSQVPVPVLILVIALLVIVTAVVVYQYAKAKGLEGIWLSPEEYPSEMQKFRQSTC